MGFTISLPNMDNDNSINNIFNCNLDTLENFFPPEGFEMPKDITYLKLGFYITHYEEYRDRFDKEILIPVDKFRNTELYYKFMKDDLGLDRDPNYPKAPLKYMYEQFKLHTYTPYSEVTDDLRSKEASIKRKMNEYIILADKNIIFAKDQLKRMRSSVTAMDKRLKKQCSYENLYMITDLTRYFRKTLDIYQDYISDKTEVAKRLYDDIIKSLNALQSVKYM